MKMPFAEQFSAPAKHFPASSLEHVGLSPRYRPALAAAERRVAATLDPTAKATCAQGQNAIVLWIAEPELRRAERKAEMERHAAAEGFGPHFKSSPVTAPWEPLFSRRGERSVELGLWVREAHCNSRGFVHGGVIATLADNAMGLTCVACHAGVKGALTVSLNLDYVATARLGQWLQITPRVIKAGGSLDFVDALITADGEIAARASATFRIYS